MIDSTIREPTTIGLSNEAHSMLKHLSEDKKNGFFADMVDAYRFGIALAIAYGVIPDELSAQRTTIFNVGTLDPNKQIYTIIRSLLTTGDVPVYRWAERLAEWGVREMSTMSERGELDIVSILTNVRNGQGQG